MEQINLHVLFFASLKDLTGVSKCEVRAESGIRVAELRQVIARKFPYVESALVNVIVAVNQQFSVDDDVILSDAEVAFFPPVSGGTVTNLSRVEISSRVIDINALLAEVTQKTTGAAAIFTGMIRGETHGEKSYETIGLEYEAYQPMAIAKMNQIVEEIHAKWPDVENIILVQRIGYMDAGTPTVVVICTSGHRESGIFNAAKYGIDRIKEIVPVWKKEISSNGESWVEGDYFPARGE